MSGIVPATAVSDDALWVRAQDNDPDAFALLFERHGRTIYNYCFRRTADWTTAEDLTSLVFLEAWRRRAQHVEAGKVLPWLYGIATNVIRNRRRAERRHRAAIGRLSLPEPTPDFAAEVVERLDDQGKMAQILRLIAKLPRRQQDVLALCGWSALSYEDASAALGIPVGTVKSALFRAIERLTELSAPRGHQNLADPSTEECEIDA